MVTAGRVRWRVAALGGQGPEVGVRGSHSPTQLLPGSVKYPVTESLLPLPTAHTADCCHFSYFPSRIFYWELTQTCISCLWFCALLKVLDVTVVFCDFYSVVFLVRSLLGVL